LIDYELKEQCLTYWQGLYEFTLRFRINEQSGLCMYWTW